MPSAPPKLRTAAPLSERERKAAIDMRRGSASSRGYGWHWRKVRAAVLASEPLCRECLAEGFSVAAQEVDHVDGDSRNNDRDNLRPLCKTHHSRRTARDQGFAKGMGGSNP